MDFEHKYIDELIEDRKLAREQKDWKQSDLIRDYLDTKLVFVFDTKFGQEIYYLPVIYFDNKEHRVHTMAMSNRQFVEHQIKQDIRADNNFDAWLYSVRKSITN